MRLTALILALKGFFGLNVFIGMSPSSSSRGTSVRAILEAAARATTALRPWRTATRRAKPLAGA